MTLYLHGFASTHKPLPVTRKTLGDLGELTVARHLQKVGMTAEKSTKQAGDLVARLGDVSVTVEVKTSFRSARGKFQFNLYRKIGNRVKTDHRHAQVLALLCVNDDYSVTLFMIPCSVVKTQTICFANPRKCKYTPYIVEG